MLSKVASDDSVYPLRFVTLPSSSSFTGGDSTNGVLYMHSLRQRLATNMPQDLGVYVATVVLRLFVDMCVSFLDCMLVYVKRR